MKYKMIIYIAGVLLFFVAFFTLFIVEQIVAQMFNLMPSRSVFWTTLYVIFNLFSPIPFAFIFSRLFIEWYEKKKSIRVLWLPTNKFIIYAFLVLYLLTAFLGVPAVQYHNTKWVIDEYKINIKEGDIRIDDSHPYIRSYILVPIFPFIIMTYHEYQLDFTYGESGWDISVWYFSGIKKIGSIGLRSIS